MDPNLVEATSSDEENYEDYLWMQQELDGFGYQVPDFLADVDVDPDDLLYDDYMNENFYYDNFSDDYSDFSDEDDPDRDHNKIFVSLQDSSVLRRLTFHRTAGRFRQPRVRLSKPETYEATFHVLEELEVLLKVWKKRTQHPFTAHISRKDAEKGEKEEDEEACQEDELQKLEFGVDYHDHDMDHESDSERGSLHPMAGEVNEALSKKKFCQSTRVFYKIFESDKKFDSLLALVRRMRKYVYNIIFGLFRRALPDVAARLLPDELWEKIWKFTQAQYDERVSFHAGLRAAGVDERELESDRVTDLFGSVGNLHMTVFEVLFKHSHITATPPLMELDNLEVWEGSTEKKHSYVKSLFTKYQRNMERHYSRLRDLETRDETGSEASGSTVSTARKESCSSGRRDGEQESSELINLISKGHFTLHKEVIPPIKKKSTLDSYPSDNEMCFTSETASHVVAFLDCTVTKTSSSDQVVSIIVWNTKAKKRMALINTEMTYLQSILGVNHNQPEQLFAISEGTIAFLDRSIKDKEGLDSFVLYQWQFNPEGDRDSAILGMGDCKVKIEGVLASAEGDYYPVSRKARVSLHITRLDGGKEVFVVCHQNPFKCETSLIFYDANTGEEMKGHKMVFQDRDMMLEALKGSRAMMRDYQSKDHLFLELSAPPTVLETYGNAGLCADASHDHKNPRTLTCVYEVKFDQLANRKQFLLFSQNLASYQLFEYDDSEKAEDKVPEVIASGSTLCYELNWRSLPQTSLMSGVLFIGHQRDLQLRTHSGDYFIDDSDVEEYCLHAFDLYRCQVHPLAALIVNGYDSSVERTVVPKNLLQYGATCLSTKQFETTYSLALMNDHSRRWFITNAKKSPTYVADESTLLVTMPHSYVSLSFHREGAKETMEADAEQLAPFLELKRKQEEEERKRKEKDRKRRELRAAREADKERRRLLAIEKYVDKDPPVTVSGKLIAWYHSYGFLHPFEYDMRVLGNVFVHISDIDKKSRAKRNQRFKFSVIKQDDGKLRATNVQHLPHEKKPADNKKKVAKEGNGEAEGAVGGEVETAAKKA